MKHFLDSLLNGPARYTQAHHVGEGKTLTIVLGVLFLEFGVVYLLFLLIITGVRQARSCLAFVLRRCGVGKQAVAYSFLQLTFPSNTTKSAFATEQLHILLRNSIPYQGVLERLANWKYPYSLELVASQDDGIRYIIKVPQTEEEVVSRTLLSYLPGLKITPAQDYLPASTAAGYAIVELALGNDFVLPLADHKALEEHDIIAYLTGHMRSLGQGELIAIQAVTLPVFRETHSMVQRHITNTQQRIALNKELTTKLARPQKSPAGLLFKAVLLPLRALLIGVRFVAGLATAFFTHDLPESWKSTGSNRSQTNPYEQELGKQVKSKLDQPLFEVSLRILVMTTDAQTATKRINAMAASFQPFANSRQSIRIYKPLPFTSRPETLLQRFQERSLSPHVLSQPTILSSSELADIYHFPNTDLTKTEGLVKSRSRDLPAPLSLKHSNVKLDVIIGKNTYGGHDAAAGLTLEQRQKHTYVIGKTGTGKTTLLTNAIYQDMVNGKGVAVIDPHGDMFRELLAIVPEHRRQDVIVFDPSDRQYPIGLNLLAPGVHFDDEEDAHEWITSMVLSVFAKLADESFWGPRMEHVLRNATLTALQQPNPSLYTLQRLLTDKKYQREIAKTITDPVLKSFWAKELAAYGDMQLASLVAPLTHRLGHFITTKMSRHILLQEKSTISISDIMNEGKILLVNLSKGDVGEDQSFFFGTLLTSLIWMAAYQRTKLPEPQRKDFFLYIDEFQNFATQQFTDITSEGRKFHVSLVASHQNIAQIKDTSVLKTVAANVGSIICLKASPDDEAFILPFMEPAVEQGDIVNLAPHHFFMKTTTDSSEEAFSGTTQQLDVEPSSKTRNDVITQSREHHATPRKDVEAYLEKLFDGQSY